MREKMIMNKDSEKTIGFTFQFGKVCQIVVKCEKITVEETAIKDGEID